MAQKVAVIDYGAGNLRSMANALAAAADRVGRPTDVVIADAPDRVYSADRIVLPGVGAFGACMDGLMASRGMLDALHKKVRIEATPFLGVCVGMQMLADAGEEQGPREGLGWLPGRVRALAPTDQSLPIPHMGWSLIEAVQHHPVIDAIGEGAFAYFAHSYAFDAQEPGDVIATTTYGGPFACAMARANVVAVQFHPEKSQTAGLRLLAAWLDWTPDV